MHLLVKEMKDTNMNHLLHLATISLVNFYVNTHGSREEVTYTLSQSVLFFLNKHEHKLLSTPCSRSLLDPRYCVAHAQSISNSTIACLKFLSRRSYRQL